MIPVNTYKFNVYESTWILQITENEAEELLNALASFYTKNGIDYGVISYELTDESTEETHAVDSDGNIWCKTEIKI